jgi:hypothetical protein
MTMTVQTKLQRGYLKVSVNGTTPKIISGKSGFSAILSDTMNIISFSATPRKPLPTEDFRAI